MASFSSSDGALHLAVAGMVGLAAVVWFYTKQQRPSQENSEASRGKRVLEPEAAKPDDTTAKAPTGSQVEGSQAAAKDSPAEGIKAPSAEPKTNTTQVPSRSESLRGSGKKKLFGARSKTKAPERISEVEKLANVDPLKVSAWLGVARGSYGQECQECSSGRQGSGSAVGGRTAVC